MSIDANTAHPTSGSTRSLKDREKVPLSAEEARRRAAVATDHGHASRESEFARDVGKALALGGAYYVAAFLSLRLALVGGQVTPLWPPTGIAVVGLLLFGRKVWPGIAIGAFLVNAPIGPTVVTAAGITAGNTLAPLVAVFLLEKVGFRDDIGRLRDAFAIVFIGAVSMTVSATGGSVALLLSGSVPLSGFWSTWFVWWTGDAMGVFIVAPFLLSLRELGRDLPTALPIEPRRAGEACLLFGGLVTVAYVVFQSELHVQYLVFPFLAWAALRFQQRGAPVTAFVASGIAVWAAVNSTGPFAGGTLLDRMVTLQIFNATVAFGSLVLAAVVVERARDREQRRIAEEERERMQARLHESERLASMGRIAGYMAHEVNTPLTNISLLTAMAAKRSQNPDIVARLEKIDAQRRLISSIVQDLLGLTRPLVIEPADLDVREIVDGALEQMAPYLREGVALLREPTDRPVAARVDRRRLQLVLVNLLKNALQATSRGVVGVRVEDRGETIAIAVADTGPGIPPDVVEKLFQPFFTTKKAGSGTGLGLAFAKNIVAAHGGTIQVASAIGKGSTFTVVVPKSPGGPAKTPMEKVP